MKTIQVVLDERTLAAADRAASRGRMNRSALIREALGQYLARLRESGLEERHRRGYAHAPVQPGEFDVWDRVQGWPED